MPGLTAEEGWLTISLRLQDTVTFVMFEAANLRLPNYKIDNRTSSMLPFVAFCVSDIHGCCNRCYSRCAVENIGVADVAAIYLEAILSGGTAATCARLFSHR